MQTAQYHAKTKAQTSIQLGSSDVSELVLPAALLQSLWVERNEIQYQGKMYDVISSEYLQDSVRLVVFQDRYETGVLQVLQHIWGQNKHKNARDWQHSLSQWFFSPITAPVLVVFRLTPRLVLGQPPQLFVCLATQNMPGILAPPPKLIPAFL